MLCLKPISCRPEDVASLQSLLEATPSYARISTGELASPGAAMKMIEALPPKKERNDKFVFGVYANETLVGCVDLIRDFPRDSVAHIGLLLISEDHQCRGYGTMTFSLVSRVVEQWQTCSSFRLGVLETNTKAKRSWTKLGFHTTGEESTYQAGQTYTKVILYERTLHTAA